MKPLTKRTSKTTSINSCLSIHKQKAIRVSKFDSLSITTEEVSTNFQQNKTCRCKPFHYSTDSLPEIWKTPTWPQIYSSTCSTCSKDLKWRKSPSPLRNGQGTDTAHTDPEDWKQKIRFHPFPVWRRTQLWRKISARQPMVEWFSFSPVDGSKKPHWTESLFGEFSFQRNDVFAVARTQKGYAFLRYPLLPFTARHHRWRI